MWIFPATVPLTSADVADTKILAMFAQLAQRLPFSSKVCPVVLVRPVGCWWVKCVVSMGPLVSGNTGPWVLGSRYGPVHPPQNTSDCKVFASAQKTLQLKRNTRIWEERKIWAKQIRISPCLQMFSFVYIQCKDCIMISQFSISVNRQHLISNYQWCWSIQRCSCLTQICIILTVSQVYISKETLRGCIRMQKYMDTRYKQICDYWHWVWTFVIGWLQCVVKK